MSFDDSKAVPVVWMGAQGIKDSFTVTLTDLCDKPTHMQWINSLEPHSQVRFDYKFIKAYSAQLDSAALEAVRKSPDVKNIRQNHYMVRPMVGNNDPNPQTDASWGLQRITQRDPLPYGRRVDEHNYTFALPPLVNPNPVNVYVIDSGVYIHHHDFENRASFGSLFEVDEDDKIGHGTIVAGIIAGKRWGVAKHARIIALKDHEEDPQSPAARINPRNFEEDKRPESDWIVASVDWAREDYERKGVASILHLSLGGQHDEELNEAVDLAVKAGMHVVVAAGNEMAIVDNQSPTSVDGVVVVGATDIRDYRPSWSNYGPKVTVYAPGEDVTSTWVTGPDDYTSAIGSSYAAPYATGVMAYILGKEGNMPPATLLKRIQSMALEGVVGNLDDENSGDLLNAAALIV
ncbi:hypothetical protein V5O48_007353 [Marasmius crinis-equi]|uniref:Peptidase S8/S53 domain-containing protein n=1 Tax=Marasmius crinis-equi TaxID=585013 RepID=A0ABR3FGY1_9AGAR